MRHSILAAICAAALIVSSLPAEAQSWARSHGNGGYNRAFAVAATPDGGMIAVGDAEAGSSIYRQFHVIKMFPSGNIEWVKTYGTDRWDIARSVRPTPDGGYVVLGESGYIQGHLTGGALRDFWLLKLDAAGDLEWQRSYGGAAHDYAQDVTVTADGGYALTGETQSFGVDCADVWVLRLDGAGDVVWQKAYGTTDCDRGYEIVEMANGDLVVGGHISNSAATDMNALVMRLDDDGTLLWGKSYGPATGDDWVRSLDVDAAGNLFVGGTTTSYGGVGRDWLLMKLDGSGTVLFAKQVDGARDASSPNDELGALRLTGDGGFVVAGARPTEFPVSMEVWLQQFDAAGDWVWGRVYRTGSDDDAAHDVQVLPGGGLIAAGETDAFDVGSAWFLRTAADGSIDGDCQLARWSFTFPVDVTVPVADAGLGTTVTDAVAENRTLAEGAVGAGSSVACIGSPTEVSPPGAYVPLTFDDKQTLRWQDPMASNAETFNVYRGDLSLLGSGDYGTCFQSGLAGATVQDSSSPPSGVGWSYTVAGHNVAGEGILGYRSDGTLRPNSVPCP